jgi:hypothetical protein
MTEGVDQVRYRHHQSVRIPIICAATLATPMTDRPPEDGRRLVSPSETLAGICILPGTSGLYERKPLRLDNAVTKSKRLFGSRRQPAGN